VTQCQLQFTKSCTELAGIARNIIMSTHTTERYRPGRVLSLIKQSCKKSVKKKLHSPLSIADKI